MGRKSPTLAQHAELLVEAFTLLATHRSIKTAAQAHTGLTLDDTTLFRWRKGERLPAERVFAAYGGFLLTWLRDHRAAHEATHGLLMVRPDFPTRLANLLALLDPRIAKLLAVWAQRYQPDIDALKAAIAVFRKHRDYDPAAPWNNAGPMLDHPALAPTERLLAQLQEHQRDCLQPTAWRIADAQAVLQEMDRQGIKNPWF